MLGSFKPGKDLYYHIIDRNGQRIGRPTFEEFEATCLRPNLSNPEELEQYENMRRVIEQDRPRKTQTGAVRKGGPIQIEGVDERTRNHVVRFIEQLHEKDPSMPYDIKKIDGVGDAVIIKFRDRIECPIAHR